MKLSVVIPARNERQIIGDCLDQLVSALSGEGRDSIPFELIVVDDNSTDDTASIVRERATREPRIRLVRREPPAGFGRAVRAGLGAAEGDMVAIFMADLSDDPEDLLLYYRKIEEGYDCVFGSRFIAGSSVSHYPFGKLVLNRIVNRAIRWLFWTEWNDLTNAFKAYRTDVLKELGELRAEHFDASIELSLGAVVGGYRIAQVPIRWRGRQKGHSKLKLLVQGPPFGRTVLGSFLRRFSRAGAPLSTDAVSSEGELVDTLASEQRRISR